MIESSIYIHAAPLAVYRAFADVARWPQWYPGVIQAEWIQGEAWQDGATLRTRVQSIFGPTTGFATVRMSVPGRTLVYENAMPGLQIVCTVNFDEDVGGCKLTIRKYYHGLLAFMMTLLQGRQQSMLISGLSNLKRSIEGVPRR